MSTDGPSWASPDPQPDPPASQPPPPPPGWAAPPPSITKPGVIPLRPLGLSEILDGAISTMRAHPRLMLGVSAIVVTISQLLSLFATLPLLDDLNRAAEINEFTPIEEIYSLLGTSLLVLGITVLVTLLARVFLSGFLTVVVGQAVLGRPTSFRGEWGRVRPRLPALLGLSLVYPAIALAAAVVVVVITIAVPPLGVLLAIAIVPIAIWLYILFSLATPALMLENARIGTAFGRSRRLVRGSWWRIFGITLLTSVIAGVVSLVINAPFTYFAGGFDQLSASEPTAPGLGALIVGTIGGIIAGTLTEPFAAGVTVLLYTDQRMRREGMDIELARATSG